MQHIYIVNHGLSGYEYCEVMSSYHHTEEDAFAAFRECKESVGEEPSLIEVVRLDIETLEGTCLESWEGNEDDLDEVSNDEWKIILRSRDEGNEPSEEE